MPETPARGHISRSLAQHSGTALMPRNQARWQPSASHLSSIPLDQQAMHPKSVGTLNHFLSVSSQPSWSQAPAWMLADTVQQQHVAGRCEQVSPCKYSCKKLQADAVLGLYLGPCFGAYGTAFCFTC